MTERIPSLSELFWGMLQVALSAFGGGLSAWSQRIVVEQRRWMSNEQFLTGLTVARLFPGPNQINMAVYIGAEFHGLPGALVALAGMLLLPFSLLMGLGMAYFHFHTKLNLSSNIAQLRKQLYHQPYTGTYEKK